MDAQKIGQRLRTLRAERTVEEVASAIGISKSAIFMYEAGHRIPSDNVKIKLSEFFGVSVADIFYS